MKTSKSSKGTKRPAEEISIPDDPKGILDFTNPNSTRQLQIADIEFVFDNGTLYANAVILLTLSDTFFSGVITDAWRSTERNEMHRVVYKMSDTANVGLANYQSMLPILHLAYSQTSVAIKCIQDLFSSLPMFDEFLAFANKILCSNLIEVIHKAISERKDNHIDIYPILKKHSKYGTLPGLVSSEFFTKAFCLEKSFFANFLRKEVINPPDDSKRRFQIRMFDSVMDTDDVQFYWDNFCSPAEYSVRLHTLRLFLLFNAQVLTPNWEKFELKTWSTAEICSAAEWSRVFDTPALMEKLLRHINSSN